MTTEALKLAREALKAVEPFVDALVCYASTISEYPPNAIPSQVAAALAALDSLPQAEPAEMELLPETEGQPEIMTCAGPLHEEERGHWYSPAFVRNRVAAETAHLRAELESMRKNDARYRWLRNTRGQDFAITRWNPDAEDWDMLIPDGDALDAAIDAAMSAPPASES